LPGSSKLVSLAFTMNIVTAPNPVLRVKATEVTPAELRSLRSTARQMAKLMYKTQGCGLAAPQVGLAKRLIIVDTEWGPQPDAEDGTPQPDVAQNPVYYFNPRIVRLWGEKVMGDEGCLSIPGIQIPIERYTNIEVEAVDMDGEPFTVVAEGFPARALQHELDHLEGMTMFEHLDPIARIQYLRDYEAALAAGAKPGDVGRAS
jgi:peptide deformylase